MPNEYASDHDLIFFKENTLDIGKTILDIWSNEPGFNFGNSMYPVFMRFVGNVIATGSYKSFFNDAVSRILSLLHNEYIFYRQEMNVVYIDRPHI